MIINLFVDRDVRAIDTEKVYRDGKTKLKI